jgi:tRNA(Ile2) C34 agmatinyltransferase TiaS
MDRRKREPKCESCGAAIVAVLSDAGSANGFLCLDCSGATLEDFNEFDDEDDS